MAGTAPQEKTTKAVLLAGPALRLSVTKFRPFWVGGLIPWLHKPQVWIDRADLERARSLLQEYDRRQHRRRPGRPSDEGPVEAECEDCRKTSVFPAKHRGTVQNCPSCGAYVDVGIGDDDWEEAPESEEGEAEER
jgi:hypothetical protein